MEKYYAAYDPSGLIVFTTYVEETLIGNFTIPSATMVETVALTDPSLEYFLGGVLTPRPANPTIASATTIVVGNIWSLSSIPNLSRVRFFDPARPFDGSLDVTITDGVFNLECQRIGNYTATIESFPYTTVVFVLDVTT